MSKYVIVQINIYVLTSLLNIIYLISFKPFKEPIVNKVELFNEVTIYFVGSICYCFTNY